MGKLKRVALPPIGEYYSDMLLYDSFITGRTQSMQAASLLCAKLQEREQKIESRLQYLAEKRGLALNDFKKQIRDGVITNEELSED